MAHKKITGRKPARKKGIKIFDAIYDSRREIIKYFIVAFVCSGIKMFVSIGINGGETSLKGADLVITIIWAAVFYPCLKFFVYKDRSPSVFILLRQIMIYTFSIAAVWTAGSFLKYNIYGVSNNAGAAVAVGGALQELVCFILMHFIVFKRKINT